MLKLHQYKLKNGLTLLYCKTSNHVEFEISMHIKTGARNESKHVSGISHFLEHMMFRGSREFPNSITLARCLEQFGGEINAITSMEHTTYWMKGDAEMLMEAIPYFAEFFLNPTFPDIELERGVILQELASDYNDQGVCIDVDHLAMQTIFHNHPLGNPIIGNYDSVKKISDVDLHEKRNHDYIPELCVLTIYSSQDENVVFRSITKYFDNEWSHIKEKSHRRPESKLISFKHDPVRNTKIFLSLQNNIDNQFSMKLIFPIIGGLSERTIHAFFLQRILDDGISTRLPGNIREQHGLVYDISCDTQFFYEIGILSIDLTVSSDRLENLLNKMSYEFKSLLSTPPTKEEIKHIQARYLFDLKQMKQSPSLLLNRHVNALFMDSSFSLHEEEDVVKNLDAKTILETAQNTFVQNYRGLALIGPKAKKQRNVVEKFLKIFEN